MPPVRPTRLTLIVVSEVSPFSSKLQVPRMPGKSLVPRTAARMASRSLTPARSIAARATLAAS